MAEDVAELLRSRRMEDRIKAVSRAGRLPEPERQTLLLQALEDRANYVAAEAAKALGACADWDAAVIMRERFLYLAEDGLKRDPGCHIRAHLAFAFGRLEFLPAVDVLRAGIRTVQIESVGGVPFDTGAHLRANCALALAQIRARDAVRDIAPMLFDSGTTVEPRKAAAQALARTGESAALIPLAIKLIHPMREEHDVLQECMQAVVDLEDPRAMELLEPYLHHRDPFLIAYAALMIARLRSPGAAALIGSAIQGLSGDALKAGVMALTTLRTDEAQSVLLELATDKRKAMQEALAEAGFEPPTNADPAP